VAPEDFHEWKASHGRCMFGGVAIGDHYALDRVDDRDFLAAQVVDLDEGGPLAVRTIVAEDGSWERAQLLHAETGRPCAAVWKLVGDEPLEVCALESIGATGNAFASSDCSSHDVVRVTDDGTCDLPPFASDGVDWWGIGEPYVGDVFALYDTECAAVEILADVEVLFERGDPVDAPTTVEYVRALAPDGEDDRLQPWGVEVDGVPQRLTRHEGGWYDAVLEFPCQEVALPEGGLACAPATTDEPQDWGDPECARIPVVRAFEGATPPILVRAHFDGCRLVAEDAQGVVGPWTEPVYRIDETGACTAIDTEGGMFVQVGSYVDLADLPALVVETLEPDEG
jgi:hypothetical protein